MFSVTYPFLLAASETFPTEADLATVLGLLSAAVTATSFVVSIVLANRVYARFGVAGAALLLPLVYLAGFGLWLVTFSFATAALVRFTQQVTQRGTVERRLERVLQRGPDRAAGPGARLQRRRARPDRDDPVGRPPAGRRARSWRATRCSGSAR